MRPLLLLALCPFAATAAAGDAPGAKAQVEVTTAACTALAGAAYVPGVDVSGNAVAPADLPRANSTVGSDTISVEIDPKLVGNDGVPAAGGAYRTRPVLGYVTVTDGHAFFNGKPLVPEASDAVAAACSSAVRK
jgi:hypothetical protein